MNKQAPVPPKAPAPGKPAGEAKVTAALAPNTAPASAEPEPPPFFVLGCVRSGTTMLRDALRMHPNLGCPEETHFFRWGEPYGTEALTRVLSGNPVLKKHRAMDGITEDEFAGLLGQCSSRGELYHRYMALYLQRKKPGARRWFDKTPQNIYGALLAASSMPRTKFVHIVREPINVVASLRIGRIVKVDSLTGACNYWNEAVQIVAGLKRAYPARVYELRYEDFVAQPVAQLKMLLDFLGEPFDETWFERLKTRPVDHQDEGVLGEEELATVRKLCSTGRRRYGYEAPNPAAAPAGGISNKVPGPRKAAGAAPGQR